VAKKMRERVNLKATKAYCQMSVLQALSRQRNVKVVFQRSSEEEVACVTASGALLAMWSDLFRTILGQRLDATFRTDDEEFVVFLPDFRPQTFLLLMEFLSAGRQSKTGLDGQTYSELMSLLKMLRIYGLDCPERHQDSTTLKEEPLDDNLDPMTDSMKDDDVTAEFSYQPFLFDDLKNQPHNGPKTSDDCDTNEKKEDVGSCLEVDLKEHEEDMEEAGKVAEDTVATNTSSQGYECKICGKKFRDRDHARQHTSVHFKIPQLQCVVCNKTYMARSAGQYHLKTAHQGEGKMVQINADKLQQVLGKFFSRTENGISSNQDVSNGQVKGEEMGEGDAIDVDFKMGENGKAGAFECQRCHKSFKSKFLLDAHKNFAYGICEAKSECICEICGFEASSISKLAHHQNTHLETSKHKCLQCSKAFTKNEALKNHMHIHTGEKMFVCEICGREFAWKRALDAHVLGVHQKMNRYECALCGAKYRNRLNVRRHLVTHFNIAQYACTVCRQEFMVASTCAKHVKKVHGGIEISGGGVTVTNSEQWKKLSDEHIVQIHCRKQVKNGAAAEQESPFAMTKGP